MHLKHRLKNKIPAFDTDEAAIFSLYNIEEQKTLSDISNYQNGLVKNKNPWYNNRKHGELCSQTQRKREKSMKRSSVYCSDASDAKIALEEVCGKIEKEGETPILIIFFAEYDIFIDCAQSLKSRFPNALTIGSTSYVNFCSRGNSTTGLSVMTVNSGVECTGGALFEAGRYPMNYRGHIQKALSELSSTENTCCIEFTTAFSMGEELVLDTFDSELEGKNIPVIGGSSGTHRGDTKTIVSLNGEVYIDTCVFAFVRNLEGRIAYIKENIFRPMNTFFTATDVDCEERLVYEFDNKPAAKMMEEALGAKGDALREELKNHPIGRIKDDEIFITEYNEIGDDESISYYARVYNMTRMVLLELDDIEEVWEETTARAAKMITKPSFSLVINCLSRSRMFEKDNLFESFCNTLKSGYGTYIGLSGYGEQLKNVHLNQSMLVLMFE